MDETQKRELSQVLKENGEMNPKNSEGNISKENLKNLEETVQEIDILNDKHIDNISHDMKEELSCDEKEILPQDSSLGAEKPKVNMQRSQPASVEKKAKTIPKQNLKGRHTVPQPFSLATEKRMSREKSGSDQFKPSLSKSISLRANSHSPLRAVQTQTSLRLERITELRHGATKTGSVMQSVIRTQTSLRVERSVELRHGSSKSTFKNKEHSEKLTKPLNQKKEKDQEKEVDTKKPQSNSKSKQYEEDMDINMAKKISTFKASPLPRFYHKRSASLKPDLVEREEEMKVNKMQDSTSFKASPLPSFYRKKAPSQKPELIKIPLTQPKSPNLGTGSKSTSDLGNKAENTNKAASRTISNSAKETIKNLLKGSWKAPDRKRKEAKNSRASGRDEIDGGVASSVEGNNVVASS